MLMDIEMVSRTQNKIFNWIKVKMRWKEMATNYMEWKKNIYYNHFQRSNLFNWINFFFAGKEMTCFSFGFAKLKWYFSFWNHFSIIILLWLSLFVIRMMNSFAYFSSFFVGFFSGLLVRKQFVKITKQIMMFLLEWRPIFSIANACIWTNYCPLATYWFVEELRNASSSMDWCWTFCWFSSVQCIAAG